MKLFFHHWIHHTLTAMLITQAFMLALIVFVVYYSGTEIAWQFVKEFYPTMWLPLSTLPAIIITLPVAVLDGIIYKQKA